MWTANGVSVFHWKANPCGNSSVSSATWELSSASMTVYDSKRPDTWRDLLGGLFPSVSLSFLLLFFFNVFFFFQNRVSTQSWLSWNYHVDHAGLKLKNPPASVGQVQGLEGCITTARPTFSFLLSVVHQSDVTKALTLEMSRQSSWKPHYLGVSSNIT